MAPRRDTAVPSKPVIRSAGEGLQTQDHRDLLDVIDTLRSQGIGRYVDLPQIIVCGDQSSGKSSVLEAISGLSFPTKDNLCTRFATELILRRDPSVGVEVGIIPSHDRTDDEKKSLEAFHCSQKELDVGEVVEAAKKAMGLGSDTKVFSTDILRIEISGPTQPHLTMVDLPGLFLAGNKDQSQEDAALVESLVLSYMQRPRSIILAVVSAKSDFALQQVTRHARALDPLGVRTLGLITKPDTLDIGSDSERFYVELAQNKDVQFRLGWHVLRNRSYVTRDISSAERDQAETKFFSDGVWTMLDVSQLGVAHLRVRLSNVLRDQIVSQLPSVLSNVETGIQECQSKLSKLGAARGGKGDQIFHLITIYTAFTHLIKAAVDGNYTDKFFSQGADSYPKRLRAVIQNILLDFATLLHTKGHAKTIVEQEPIGADNSYITRAAYIAKVKTVMKDSRGRELPGSYNPLIVAQLFSEQCEPWKALVDDLGSRVLASAHATVSLVLQHVTDTETAAKIFRIVIAPLMEEAKASFEAKLDEILRPHLSGHPITYNHYLTENIQQAQNARRKKEMERQLQRFFPGNIMSDRARTVEVNTNALLKALALPNEADMDTYSCSMAVDTMEAYYKVALKTVIDEIAVLAVEKCLLEKLPQLLKPETACNLTAEEVQLIATESDVLLAERKRLNEKLSVLRGGLTQLGRFKGRLTSIEPSIPLPKSPHAQSSGKEVCMNSSGGGVQKSWPIPSPHDYGF